MIRKILAFITLFCVVPVLPLDAQEGPEGSKPFAIVHYGCHGASYLGKPSDYDAPCKVMERADSLGLLTPLGQDVVGRLRLIRQDARNHWGELTEQGIREQQEIARRMMARFPEVLNRDCSYIGARSLRNTRSMLSMEQLLVEVSKVCRIRVYHNASNAFSSYLNSLDESQLAVRKDSAAKAAYEAISERYSDGDRLAKTLFSDSDFIRSQVDVQMLNDQLFKIAANIRQTGTEGKVTLNDLFTADEISHQRKRQEAWNNLNFGGEVRIPFVHQLLRHLIHCTDTAQTFKQSAVFHIADETSFLPLVSLLGIDSWSEECGVWSENSPASKNLQFVLYRKNPEDQDVWIKVLLNEQEVSLPLPSAHAPYYRLKDFQEYYLEKVKRYE
ncbi:MAG: hypothetical protein IJ059_05895 [Prevotella sp.]|nr:hypothetical protein [Prevotella sp.]